MNKILTLTTDFGIDDAYVAIMKGVISSIAPAVRMVDITHNIAPQDVMEAAFVLKSAAPYFPPGAIHLAVIDPGVGTDRRPVALRMGDHWYVGPDNGLFSLLLNGSTPDEAVVLNKPAFWRTPDVSQTFHGRDIFAPIAAHIAAGRTLTQLGSPIESLTPLYWALPIADQQGVQGWVVHVDRFGNCITNIEQSMIDLDRHPRGVKCYVGSTILDTISTNYASTPAGEPLMLFDSHELLEIAVNSGNASELLSIRKGSPVNIVFLDERS